jgi:DNA-binding CsgD family transcriptional regulator
VKTQRIGIALTQANIFSEREKEVIELLKQGKSNRQISLALAIAESTVESHLTRIYAKLGVSSRVEAILRLGQLGKALEPAVEGETGESIIEIEDPIVYSPNEPVLLDRERPAVAKKVSLAEIIRFLVTYKFPIFIWILLILILVVVVLSSNKTPWSYEREGENPDDSTVGHVIQRSSASQEMVHGQFGTVPAWPAQSGYVKYKDIKIPRTDHLFLKLRYSKYSSSSVRILVYLDDELAQRATILPVDQGSWDKFVWTDAIDLGSVKRGVHSIKFYTDGQEFGVADLDKFTLTTEPP